MYPVTEETMAELNCYWYVDSERDHGMGTQTAQPKPKRDPDGHESEGTNEDSSVDHS